MLIRIFFVLCSIILVHKEPVLSWSNSYKLSWPDFKAQPNVHSTAVAITASGITFGFSIKQTDGNVVGFKTNVNAYFYPEQSWYKPKRANNHVLRHEQLHFDITELHARKFRNRISKLKVTDNIKAVLQDLHNTINNELAAMQDDYDDETNYSRNTASQAKWETFIKAELKKLSEFKSN